MSTVSDLLDHIEHDREIIAAVRNYALRYDDHIRVELLAILEGEVVE